MPGEQVAVELTVSNDGVDDETDRQLQLVFPSGLVRYSEGLFGGPITTVASCTGGASNVFCEPGELIVFIPGLLASGASVPASVPGLTPVAPPGSVPGSLLQFRATARDATTGSEATAQRAVPEPSIGISTTVGCLLLLWRRRTVLLSIAPGQWR